MKLQANTVEVELIITKNVQMFYKFAYALNEKKMEKHFSLAM